MVKTISAASLFEFPFSQLKSENKNVALNDLEFSVKFEEGLAYDFSFGTPGFISDEFLINSSQRETKRRLILKDIYALGNIIFAVFNRETQRLDGLASTNSKHLEDISYTAD